MTILENHTNKHTGQPEFVEDSFSLSDIDPNVKVTDAVLVDGTLSVEFHTTNYTDKIRLSQGDFNGEKPHAAFDTSNYAVWMAEKFAPRFAKALKHAVELCGGKRSAF